VERVTAEATGLPGRRLVPMTRLRMGPHWPGHKTARPLTNRATIRSHTRNLRFLGTMLKPSSRRLERMRLETNRPLRSAW